MLHLLYHSGTCAKELDAWVNFTPLENGGTESFGQFLLCKYEGIEGLRRGFIRVEAQCLQYACELVAVMETKVVPASRTA